MRYLLLGAAFLLSILTEAKQTIVKGVSTIPAQSVRAIVQSDLISGLETVVGRTKTDFKGEFDLSFEINEIQFVEIAIGLSRASFIAVPGAEYTVQFTMAKSAQRSYFDPPPLQMRIIKATDGGINDQIERINFIYNAFVMENFNTLYRLGRVNLLDSLKMTMKSSLPNSLHPFVDKYQEYKLASLVPLARKMNLRSVFETFFKDKDILYKNPEYMALFKEFFGVFLVNHRSISFDQFVLAVSNGNPSVDQLLASEPMLANSRQFRELVLLKLLRDNYHHPAFGRNTVKQLLNAINSNSSYLQHRQMATNIIRRQEHLAFNTPAPEISLKDYEGKLWSTHHDKKGVLIMFVREDCRVCEKELAEIRTIYENQKSHYQFITISTKEGFDQYRSFFASNRIDWPLLNLAEQLELVETYNIRVFPEFILLLPEGKVAMAPAPSVEQNLEYHMNRLKRNY